MCRRIQAARQARGEPLLRTQRAHLRAQAAAAALAELPPPSAADADAAAQAGQPPRTAPAANASGPSLDAQSPVADASAEPDGAFGSAVTAPAMDAGGPRRSSQIKQGSNDDSMDEDEPLRSICRRSGDASADDERMPVDTVPKGAQQLYAADTGNAAGMPVHRHEAAASGLEPPGGLQPAQHGIEAGGQDADEPSWLREAAPAAERRTKPAGDVHCPCHSPNKLHGSGSLHAEGLSQSALQA